MEQASVPDHLLNEHLVACLSDFVTRVSDPLRRAEARGRAEAPPHFGFEMTETVY